MACGRRMTPGGSVLADSVFVRSEALGVPEELPAFGKEVNEFVGRHVLCGTGEEPCLMTEPLLDCCPQ